MNKLKRLRKEKNETQYTLAELLSVNEKTISRWENGESSIKPDKAQQLADFFGVSVGYLLGYERSIDTSGPLITDYSMLSKINEISDVIVIEDLITDTLASSVILKRLINKYEDKNVLGADNYVEGLFSVIDWLDNNIELLTEQRNKLAN